MLKPTSRSAGNPGPRLLRFFKLRRKRPAPMSSNSDSATWATTSVLKNLSNLDRKSTRLNSSHGYISYAVFCLKKKNQTNRYHGSRDTGYSYIAESGLI